MLLMFLRVVINQQHYAVIIIIHHTKSLLEQLRVGQAVKVV